MSFAIIVIHLTGNTCNEFTRCYQNGQIRLPPLHSYPEYLQKLLTNDVPESEIFRNCIRSYKSISTMNINSGTAHDIRLAKLLIIDEYTMASTHLLHTIHKLLQTFMNSDLPFEGKVLLLRGDFRQCVAIVPHSMRSAIVQCTLKYADNWHCFQKIQLVHNMRCPHPDHNNWLLQLGDGTLTNTDRLHPDIITIPQAFICADLVTDRFGTAISFDQMPLLTQRTILCPKNINVENITTQVIALLHHLHLHTILYLIHTSRSFSFPTPGVGERSEQGAEPPSVFRKAIEITSNRSFCSDPQSNPHSFNCLPICPLFRENTTVQTKTRQLA
ncbi:uncharacterized protein LOC127528772 [Erpetoichthys calabaricus]|uniref:uncharacterized protein LOC127528772 n=1 Tax=Erpetoichthys calabaricus TaxID=27687 RepID=UPI002233E4D6|nr:uncharacterized protein LOC127528772 [Erpetoichthys calabaricus]